MLVFRNLIFEKYDTFFFNFYQKNFISRVFFLHIVIASIIIFTMDPSAALSTENREVEQLRAFIDETTAEVADARDKFKHQEDLVEAYGGTPPP